MIGTLRELLPDPLADMIARLDKSTAEQLEEIRIREGKPLEVDFQGTYAFLSRNGNLVPTADGAYVPRKDDCLKLLDMLTNHSMYSFEEELRRGYITIRGGHRVGLAGRAVLERGQVKLLRDISGFNIRIAREVRGAGAAVIRYLADELNSTIHHTLILSPPQCGKTTLLRDLARMISEGSWAAPSAAPYAMPNVTPSSAAKRARGLKVGIVDERSEIAACHEGVPTFDVGPRTDVLDACPKAEGMMMMIRSLSPQVLVVDEIGRKEDADAIVEAMHAGIRVIATAHGKNMDEIRKRPDLRPLLEAQMFGRYVVLEGTGSRRKQSIYDRAGRSLVTVESKAAAAL